MSQLADVNIQSNVGMLIIHFVFSAAVAHFSSFLQQNLAVYVTSVLELGCLI